ncbi:MATE family efflux transporter [Konateibacter massiliensis]|uniref:MATE family efflux transporter n=1 Tax=Konateibacter massiliensis TaxID=2002841 RepID=UPI000C1456DD|nr:MATE family efflux transporter [Konateibacter massiliensis]
MSKNMTEGNIPKHIVGFAIPMILGNIFQLTYNAVDSIIVGRYAGEEALAALGTSNPILNIMIFFIIGICLGASILMSEFFGAGDMDKLKREISTSMIAGSIFTVVMIIIGVLAAPFILRLIQTPEEVLPMAVSYLRISFIGLIFIFFYNIYASALRSIGDSKTPIYFLIISSIVNAGLDMVFVAKFEMGVVGAGLATAIAEALSCILCYVYIYKKVPIVQIKRKEFVFDKTLIGRTLNYSWATAMQQTVLQIGKVLVQGGVNPLGVDSIAAFNAVNRVDDFAFIPQQSIAQSMTVFIAQNRGAKKENRIQEAFRKTLFIELAYWVILLIVTIIAARSIMRLFVSDGASNIVGLGGGYLTIMGVLYIMPAFTNWIQGYFRGMGKMEVTFYSTTIQMVFRVIFVYLLIPVVGFNGIAYACGLGWVAMLLYEVPVYLRFQKRKKLQKE